MAGRVHVGTSGWVYKDWARAFYPPRLPQPRQLAYYAERFPTVEINASFYRLPERSTFVSWREQAPPGFRYAVRGSRTVTHFFKLLPGAKSFPLLMERVRALGPALGPVLRQLPPGFGVDVERLRAFVGRLPEDIEHAIEFRDPFWLVEEVYEVLRARRIASVALSSRDMPPNRVVTGRFGDVRFHGLEGGPAHDYTDAELRP